MSHQFQPGDIVVYTRQKTSSHPGPRAREVSPSRSGENYTYLVDKYWIVTEVLDDGRLRLLTRTGKEHIVESTDQRLSGVSWWDRCFKRHKFPSSELLETSG